MSVTEIRRQINGITLSFLLALFIYNLFPIPSCVEPLKLFFFLAKSKMFSWSLNLPSLNFTKGSHKAIMLRVFLLVIWWLFFTLLHARYWFSTNVRTYFSLRSLYLLSWSKYPFLLWQVFFLRVFLYFPASTILLLLRTHSSISRRCNWQR